MPYKLLCLFLFATSLLVAEQSETHLKAKQIAHQLAAAAGIADFTKIDRIEYTFKAKVGDVNVDRSWIWWPVEDFVSYLPSDGNNFEFRHREVDESSPEQLREIDQKFINDIYWLMYPFQVVWDPTVSLEIIPSDAHTNDIEATGGIRVIYPEGVGYTPGDIYEMYYDDNFLVTHWVFRKGGSATPSRITEWKDYRRVGPLMLSLDRPGVGDEGFRIWFTDVKVKWFSEPQ